MSGPPAAAPSRIDRYTSHHHVRAAAGQGVVAGIFLLNEYVARKDLGATRWHVLALLLLPALAQFAAVVWNPAAPGKLLGRRPFRTIGIPSRLLLFLPLLLPLLRERTSFVACLVTVLVAESLLIPVQNWTLAGNYARATRGRRFGAATAAQALAIAAVALPAGWLLDREPDAWPALHAIAALAGVYGYVHWSRLKRRARPMAEGPPPPERSAWRTLLEDRHFLAFEACFMVYGVGFLMLGPVLPLYLVDEMGVTYTEVGVARGLLFWLAMLVASPFIGRLADRLGMLRVAALAYVALALFPATLLAWPGTAGLFAGFVVFGAAMAGVNMAWNLGPIALAGDRDPMPYLNAHLALVGVRALVGMVSGVLIQQHAGSRPVFVIVIACELLAAAGMIATARSRGGRLRLGTRHEEPAPG